MSLVPKHADLHVRAGDCGELEGSRETLVSLGVVILKCNLKFNTLCEVSLLSFNLHPSLRHEDDRQQQMT